MREYRDAKTLKKILLFPNGDNIAAAFNADFTIQNKNYFLYCEVNVRVSNLDLQFIM